MKCEDPNFPDTTVRCCSNFDAAKGDTAKPVAMCQPSLSLVTQSGDRFLREKPGRFREYTETHSASEALQK